MRGGFVAAKGVNPQDYESAFLIHCHCLIEIGYKEMQHTDCRSSDEEVITGRLTQAIDEFLRSGHAPDWAEHFDVQEEKRINSDGREGKHRYRIDIVLKHVAGRRPEHIFEAKRLNGSGSLSKYAGFDGMGCFLDGRYSASQQHASMLGYIQTESISLWIRKLQDYILSNQEKLQIQVEWEKANLVSESCDLPLIGVTTHRRKKSLPSIQIYHHILNFSG